MTKETKKIALFEWKEIRKTIHNDEWWFSVVDIIEVLNVSWREARKYWSDLKKQLKQEGSEVSEKIGQLKLKAADGKMRLTDCWNTEVCLRIIQSIPSKKAEPFKLWLAKVGNERIQEIENPELSMQRMIETYEKKWYPKEWVDIRTRWITVRKGLTDEWDTRWWEWIWYAILTNEVYKAYSGMDNKSWKDFKWIEKWNLRDVMTPTELILTMLAEQSTADITKARDSKWLEKLKQDSKDGWWVALKARKELIEQTWKDPITEKNYLEEVKENKKLN